MREPIVFAVTGGRDYKDRDKVFRKLSKFHRKYGFTHLLSGGAKGVDTFADEWCDTVKGVQSVVCRAHWNRDGRSAGPIRNSAMAILNPLRLIAFPGGTGTSDMRGLAKRLGIKIISVT
jgi:hypothetical protein